MGETSSGFGIGLPETTPWLDTFLPNRYLNFVEEEKKMKEIRGILFLHSKQWSSEIL